MKYNYLELINAFDDWCETNYLSNLAQLLWYKLIALFNKSGWNEWVTVDNQRLMAKLRIKREATFVEYRDELIKLNFFEYQKGKKGHPNRYKICTFNFVSINRSTNSSINRSINRSIKRSTKSRHI